MAYNHQGEIIIKERNIFKENSAMYGGGIFNFEGDIEMKKNNRFENNSAFQRGGAIFNSKGELNINRLKNTFINNTPDDISQT